jgi:hypothetical protein
MKFHVRESFIVSQTVIRMTWVSGGEKVRGHAPQVPESFNLF